MLNVNEIFHSIQGEGGKAGQAMTFVRLAGCNLRCSYCDTRYAWEGGVETDELDILAKCQEHLTSWVCITGGEPLLQNLTRLVELLHGTGFMVALETNGTQYIPDFFDYVAVSPKRQLNIHLTAHIHADEWKYIIQDESDFGRITQEAKVFLQPVDNDMEIARLCANKILENPGWRLSLQLHKLIGVK